MQTKHLKRSFLIGFWVSGLLLLVLVVSIAIKPEPPVRETERARKILSEAKNKCADIYSSDLYYKAKKYYDSAIYSWSGENDRFYMVRDFGETKKFAGLSASYARDAIMDAMAHKNNLQLRLQLKIETLDTLVNNFESSFKNLPMPMDMMQKYEWGKLLLTESKYAYDNRNYIICSEKIHNSEEYLNEVNDSTVSRLANYFRNYPEWIKWTDKTLKDTRKNNKTAIIIDKFSEKCYLYKNGKPVDTFEIELGDNWMGNKCLKGDKATPEGFYKVIRKLSSGQTKYYKALLLDYPNSEDKKRFLKAVKEGTLPKDAEIGGMIEIHGGGGKGVNWTDGCIALENKNMDIVFKLAQSGTPVTIVGSVQPLQLLLPD